MRRFCLTLFVICVSFSLMGSMQPQTPRTIRLGVYENAPKIYTDNNGTVSGFWPEMS